MATPAIKVFEYGLEGGGATVYRLPDNKVIEKGSTGGILDEEEDPFRDWEKIFENWDVWWLDFTSQNQNEWIYFYPIFIHPDIKQLVKLAVDSFSSCEKIKDQKKKWYQHLNETGISQP